MVLKQIAKLFQKTPERYLEQAKYLINKNQFRQAEKKLWRGIFLFPESSACTESLLKLIKIDEKTSTIHAIVKYHLKPKPSKQKRLNA